ncbi:FAD-binding oxidoreductase [Pandoraea sp.]|uniref:FAD-binding oxidoreductase n=1 Tax=Pandoraea sp. TaxID=1883445 RepID=UPI0011F69ABD|nr:FAD-binding oxidoreductase [Pandoraea sp.]TAL52873.1 MAG: FAD-binding oxidoreductase [Pandoraea sp.]TAM19682.1 MAG: FAD-binding oxidoreductase [Pandoraea sp.]
MTDAGSLIDALADLLGADGVLRGEAELAGFIEDWRGRYRGAAVCVALPSSTGQVAAIVRLCAEHGVPVLPQGGNTSLCGGAVPAADGEPPVIVNLSRMRRIRRIDAANNSMEVEAGCVLATVQQAAAEVGRLYPISLGAEGSCQIGGTIATNAGGTGVLRYGNTRENVLGLEVVLPDGSIWNGLTALRKNNTGFDLKHLFIGAEGAMGIVTAAVLKLHPLPTRHAVAWFAPNDPAAAVRMLGMFQTACGAQLSAFEMIDAMQLELVIEHVPNRRNPLSGAHRWHGLVELADTGGGEELSQVLQHILEAATAEGLLEDAVIASSEAQRSTLWEIRHSVSEANKKAGIGLTTDCAVPVSAVPDFIEQASGAVRAIVPDLPVLVVAHLGDGNVHFIPFFSFDQWHRVPDQGALAAAIRRGVNDIASALGGTFSAEHGVGQTGLSEMARYKSAVELEMMRAVKRAFDPRHLFNPGRLLP